MSDTPESKIPNPDKPLGDSARPPKVRHVRLNSVAAVRREMAKQYNQHLRGDVSTKKLACRVTALRAITDSFVAHEQEKRLAVLEDQAGLIAPTRALGSGRAFTH